MKESIMNSKILLIASIFVVNSALQALTLYPQSFKSIKGDVSTQPLSVLSVQDQSGFDNTWSNYLELSADPSNSRQTTCFTFELDAYAQTCQTVSLRFNAKGESSSYEKWSLKVKNFETRKYETFLTNSTKDWEWNFQQASIDTPDAYVRTNGKLFAKISCKKCSVMDIDYLSLELNQCADATAPQTIDKDDTFNLQFSQTTTIDSVGFDAIEIDMEDTDVSTINALKQEGKKVICYFSAGSYEDWRNDADQFPSAVLGNDLSGWAGEKWLDISRIDLLRPIMSARMDRAVAKGCDAVDTDNVDGYTNASGFSLTYADQLAYNTMLSNEAHARGLSIALKNDVGQLSELVDLFDFAVNESCYQYNECSDYSMFIELDKPVYIIEYNQERFSNSCSSAKESGFFMIHKKRNLNDFVETCP